KQIDEELETIDKLVMQALYFSRLDTFSKDYFIQEQNLGAVMRESVKRHSKLFIGKKMKLDLQNVDIDVRTDSKWLGFIIDQVLSNALKYTADGGDIQIWCDTEVTGKKVLHIKDNGRGIKEEDLPRVFEQGFTGTIGRQEKKATGMGLYLAKQMAKKLGHEICIESKSEIGTEVRIYFEQKDDYLLIAKD
ncbi:TPA: ATP-binding protein, partial [Listeria innocua]|nr:ATP-binding protein [Listeria innocua]